MYEEYKNLCVDSRAVSRELCKSNFHELNLAVKTPRKDTCYTCDKLKKIVFIARGESKARFEKDLAAHHT
jgi:hypothetical protein